MFHIVVGSEKPGVYVFVGRGVPKDGAYAWEIQTPKCLRGITSAPIFNNTRTAANALAQYFRQPLCIKKRQILYFVPTIPFSGIQEAQRWCEEATAYGLPIEESTKIKRDSRRREKKVSAKRTG